MYVGYCTWICYTLFFTSFVLIFQWNLSSIILASFQREEQIYFLFCACSVMTKLNFKDSKDENKDLNNSCVRKIND